MFSAQVTGKISREFEKKDGKFGAASTFSIETKNKKGESSYINCIQYGESIKEAPKGSLVYVSGEIDVSQYKGKPSISMLTRNFEILSIAEDKPPIKEEAYDEMPF
jgi:hypothetical protein